MGNSVFGSSNDLKYLKNQGGSSLVLFTDLHQCYIDANSQAKLPCPMSLTGPGGKPEYVSQKQNLEKSGEYCFLLTLFLWNIMDVAALPKLICVNFSCEVCLEGCKQIYLRGTNKVT